MKKVIRQGVYETNSSSTHSICIAKNAELSLPEEINFEFGEFGWECDTLRSMSEKASYLYTGLLSNGREDDFKNIKTAIEKNGVSVTAEEPSYDTYTHAEKEVKYLTSGHVDHSGNLGEFLDAVCSDEGKLMRFLFSDLSFIITGNDNDDEDVDINVKYEHDEYYKGN